MREIEMLGQRGRLPRAHRFGLTVLAAVLTIVAMSTDPADARGRRKRSTSSYNPPSASIVVDVNSGQVLHASNPDSTRHPASLTKIMTLYLLFEQLEAGKLALDTPLEVSAHASAQAPSKLGLRPGQTIAVEDAIKALVTKSANDVAAVVAEAIAGDEDEFAKRMTRKARALGMNRTIYVNASGLPDEDQITTARDQAILGRAIQDRFPRYYRYFGTPEFRYRGLAMRNHNKLLGRVAGVDGIKTGYTRASGFNLVSSLRRGNRHLVAVVLGGSSGSQRDAKMRSLLDEYIVVASANRTAPRIAEASQATEPVASKAAEPRTVSAPIPSPSPLASSNLPSTARADSMPSGTIRATPGSSEPLQPLSVRTIAVRAAPIQAAGLVPVTGSIPMAAAAPQSLGAQAAALAQAPADNTATATMPMARPVMKTAASPAAPVEPQGDGGMQLASAASVPIPASAMSASHAVSRSIPKGTWVIQVGAFPDETQAKERLRSAQNLAKSLLAKADPFTERVVKGSKELYRARFVGLDQSGAETACKYFKRNDIECMALKN